MSVGNVAIIGRFSGFTKAHKRLGEHALSLGSKVFWFIGSASPGQFRSYKNPWTFEERVDMIRSNFSHEQGRKFVFVPVQDRLHQNNSYPFLKTGDDFWFEQINIWFKAYKIKALVGHEKDASSFYIARIKEENPALLYSSPGLLGNTNATKLRESFFSFRRSTFSTLATHRFMCYWRVVNGPLFDRLVSDQTHVIQGQKKYGKGPFLTGDTLLTDLAGRMLLVKRGQGKYGAGTWALPGGFLNEGEEGKAGALRELKEETGIDSRDVALLSQTIYDSPGRSLRGRITTHLLRAKLTRSVTPVGSDDADEAKFVPISDVLDGKYPLFEDHYELISIQLKGKL